MRLSDGLWNVVNSIVRDWVSRSVSFIGRTKLLSFGWVLKNSQIKADTSEAIS